MKKFFTEMPKHDRFMLAVLVFLALFIGALIGGAGYAFGLPLWQCLIVGSILLIVPCLHLFYMIVLYRDSQKEGTPRKSTSDYAVAPPMTQTQESPFHSLIALVGGWMVGRMFLGGNSE